MTKLKILVLFILLLAIFFTLVGCCNCHDDDTSQEGTLPLVFQGQVYLFNSEAGTIFHDAQEIGVFLIDADKKTLQNEYCNLKYYADNHNSTGYFVPEKTPVCLKAEERVDAISYYPYLETKDLAVHSRYVYPIDISNQKSIKPDAFLYDNSAKNISNSSNKVKLELRPVLSKIKLTFVQGSDISESQLRKMALTLKGVPAKAQFDLLRGEFITTSLTYDNAQITNDEIAVSVNTDLTADIVLYSSVLTKNAILHIKLPAEAGKEEVNMSMRVENVISCIEANTQYFVLAKITKSGVKAELTSKSPIYILDWSNDRNIDGYVQPENHN